MMIEAVQYLMIVVGVKNVSMPDGKCTYSYREARHNFNYLLDLQFPPNTDHMSPRCQLYVFSEAPL